MKNTSILIPIILIVCLGLLIYLFYAALQATDDNAGTGNNPIVLNQADYADGSPGDLGDNANLEPYFQDVPEDEKTVDLGSTAAADTPTTAGTAGTSAGNTRSETATTTTTPAPSTTTATTGTGTEGRYLVIAGSFRQLAGARARVDALKQAGFSDTRMERFNKGTFAVALAGQSNRYSEANRLAGKLRDAGFEARVMRRR